MNTEKKFRGSVWTTICYVLAALMLIYTCYQAGTTVKTINDYYAQYQMTAKPMEYVTYILQSTLEPLMHTVVLFMLGYIANEVRKCNPASYISDAEKADAKDAKRAAKDARQAAKGEAAAAKKAAHTAAETKKAETADGAVVANFADETKEDKPKQTRKSGGNGGNRRSNSGSSKPKKSGEGRKEGEAAKNDKVNKDSKDNKESKDNKDRKPAGGNKKNNSGSGSKSGKPAEGKTNQKPRAKKPAADDDTVEIPWEVNADFTAEVHEE